MVPIPNISAGGGGPSGASAGNQAATAYYDFTSNNAFSVGGSGGLKQNATAEGGGVSPVGSSGTSLSQALDTGNLSPLVIAGVIGGVAVILALVYVARKS